MADKALPERLALAREAAHECLEVARDIKDWADAVPELPPMEEWERYLLCRMEASLPPLMERACECEEGWNAAFTPALDAQILDRCGAP
jgi:hypothetical protein